MDQLKPSRASEAVIPVETVTLERWKTQDGSLLRVGCGAINESDLVIALGLPGARPDIADRRSKTLKELEARNFSEAAIEAGTFLLDDDGSEIRPAFYFGASAPHQKSLPGRHLSAGDKGRLAEAIFRLGGYVGGQADQAAFFRDGEGDAEGGGAVEVLPGSEADAQAGPSGS